MNTYQIVSASVLLLMAATAEAGNVLLNRFDRASDQVVEDTSRDVSYRIMYVHSEFPSRPDESARQFVDETKTTFRGNGRRIVEEIVRGSLIRLIKGE